jgi:hypothetical protein
MTLPPFCPNPRCADGFESYDKSQYFPNNIDILVGIDSKLVKEEFSRLFIGRGAFSHAKLTPEEKRIWLKQKTQAFMK